MQASISALAQSESVNHCPELPTILVADDEPVIHMGLVAVLKNLAIVLPPVATLSEISTALDAQGLPDLLILDLVFGEIHALPTLRLLKIRHPDLKVLVYTGFGDPNNCVEAMAAGANGYLVKPEEIEVVKETVLTVLGGGSWVSESVASICEGVIGNGDQGMAIREWRSGIDSI